MDPPGAAVGYPAELCDVDVQEVGELLTFVAAVAVPPQAQRLAGEQVDVGQSGQAVAGRYRCDRGGATPRIAASRTVRVVLAPGGHDLRLGLCGGPTCRPSDG